MSNISGVLSQILILSPWEKLRVPSTFWIYESMHNYEDYTSDDWEVIIK